MTPRSITGRLVLWLGGGTILFWLGAAGLGALVIRSELDEVFDSGLQETAQRLMPLVVDDLFQREELVSPRRLSDGRIPEHEEYLTYQVRARDGRVLLHSHDASPEPFDAPLVHGFSDTGTQRIYTELAVSGTLFLQIADPLAHRREATTEAAMALLLPVLLLAPFSMLVIWLIVRRSTAPIRSLSLQIGARDGTNLTPLTGKDMPAELAGIAASVDRLLERLRATIDAERQFTANTAHELRTPLAGALVQAQRLILELGDRQEAERARQIEASIRGLTSLSERLLQLARAEAGIGASTTLTDIVPIVRMVAEDFRRRDGAQDRLRLAFARDAHLVRRVDVDALAIVLRNLIENALVHGPRGEPVAIQIDGHADLAVINTGTIVPADQLHTLVRRFQRGPTTGVGSGLGLFIADTLVKQMGGRLEILSPATGSVNGFEAQVHLAI